MRRMKFSAVRAVCFDLDNTLWEIEPVLLRAERILADWLRDRYPRIQEQFSAADMLALRQALSRDEPHRAHDFTYLRRETLARKPMQVRERSRRRQVGGLADRERRELQVSDDDIDVPSFLRSN